MSGKGMSAPSPWSQAAGDPGGSRPTTAISATTPPALLRPPTLTKPPSGLAASSPASMFVSLALLQAPQHHHQHHSALEFTVPFVRSAHNSASFAVGGLTSMDLTSFPGDRHIAGEPDWNAIACMPGAACQKPDWNAQRLTKARLTTNTVITLGRRQVSKS